MPGHWEGDLLSGANNTHIVTLVERHTRFAMLLKVPSKDTATVVGALGKHVRKLPQQLRRSLTWDRGKEMADHKSFTIATNVQVYFCDPRSPWQRGSNENTNGLLRQYFPRGIDLSRKGHVNSKTGKDAVLSKASSREVPRDVHEYARDVTRRLMRTKAFLKSRDQRKRVEMRFAHLKNSPPLRAHSAARSFRCARRVPPRGYRAEPQDLGAPNLQATTRSAARRVCLRSLTIVSVASGSQVAANRAAEKPPKSTKPTSPLLFLTLSTHNVISPRSIDALRKVHSPLILKC